MSNPVSHPYTILLGIAVQREAKATLNMKLEQLMPRSRQSKDEMKGKDRRSAQVAGDAASSLIGRDDEGFLDLDADRELMEGIEGPNVSEKKVDKNFYNKFDDDFDEDDMAIG